MFECGRKLTSGARVFGPSSRLMVAVLVGLGVHLAGHWTNAADKAPVKPAAVAPAGGPDKPSAKVKPEKAVLPGKPLSDEEALSVAERKLAEIEKRSETTVKPPGKALSAEELYAKASPAGVTVSVENEDNQKIGSGSGFFVDTRELSVAAESLKTDRLVADGYGRISGEPHRPGYVLTNQHVLRGAVRAWAILPDGRKAEVLKVLAESEQVDASLLLVWVPSNRDPAVLNLAETPPPVGATVYTIGSPGGDLTNSLSAGVVSGLRKRNTGGVWIQTTASVSPGSSGGPLLACDGRVVGITTASRVDGQNLNFAVSVSDIRQFLKGPYRTRKVWKGRSVHHEERDAYSDLRFSIPRELFDKKRSAELPHAPAWMVVMADWSLERDDCQRAIEHSLRAIPTIAEEWRYLAHYTLGVAHLRVACTKRGASGNLAEMHARLRDTPDFPIAVTSLERATQLKPQFAPAWDKLADCHTFAGQWPEALLAANRFVELAPQCYQAYLTRGSCYAQLGRSAAALKDYQIAVDLNPVNAYVHMALAGAYSNLGNDENAIYWYEKAARQRPEVAWACYINIGTLYRAMGKYEKAASAYEAARARGAPRDLLDHGFAQGRRQEGWPSPRIQTRATDREESEKREAESEARREEVRREHSAFKLRMPTLRSQWRQIERDMTRVEVRRILGEPEAVNANPLGETWRYVYKGKIPVLGTNDEYFITPSGDVMFDFRGRVQGWNEPIWSAE